MNEIVKYLNKILPNAKCELNYTTNYEFLIAIMLSAQTTDKRVNEVTAVLFKKYNTLAKFKKATKSDIKRIITKLGMQEIKSNNIIKLVSIIDEDIKNDRRYIESLPGVGRKTANVFLSNIYDVDCIAVDTHVKRVSKRLGISKSENVLQIEKDLELYFKDYSFKQLHHQLVLFGRYFCKAKNPKCLNCELKNICILKRM